MELDKIRQLTSLLKEMVDENSKVLYIGIYEGDDKPSVLLMKGDFEAIFNDYQVDFCEAAGRFEFIKEVNGVIFHCFSDVDPRVKKKTVTA